MRLEYYSAEKLKKEILEIIGNRLDLKRYKVFFFGSRVEEGKGSERSDIDVGIEGPEPVPLEALFDIKEEVENLPTLYKIEIVDFKKVPPEFYEVASRHVEAVQ